MAGKKSLLYLLREKKSVEVLTVQECKKIRNYTRLGG